MGAGVLLIAALLTAIYMFTTVTRAWFPVRGEAAEHPGLREADWRMTLPHILLALAVLTLGLYAQPVVAAAARIAGLR